jgi:hypothetical protein
MRKEGPVKAGGYHQLTRRAISGSSHNGSSHTHIRSELHVEQWLVLPKERREASVENERKCLRTHLELVGLNALPPRSHPYIRLSTGHCGSLVKILIDGPALCAVVRRARTQGYNAGSCFGPSYTIHPNLRICWPWNRRAFAHLSPVCRWQHRKHVSKWLC